MDLQDNDLHEVLYASTDDGFASDDDGRNPTNVPVDDIRSPSPDLIDFSTPVATTTKCSIGIYNEPIPMQRYGTPSNRDALDLSAYPQAHTPLNPESPPFTPKDVSQPVGSSTPSSRSPSYSVYTDALQSIRSRSDSDDQTIEPTTKHETGKSNIAFLQSRIAILEGALESSRAEENDRAAMTSARINYLEKEHETLKRANDDLDMNNETLKQKAEIDKKLIHKLNESLNESESLRVRAQKTAIEHSEMVDKLHVKLANLQDEYDDMEPQVTELRNKLVGALNNTQPLQILLHDVQARLLDAVGHIKAIEAFARNHLAQNPQDIETFASVRLYPHGCGPQYDSSGQTETAALISFDEPDSVAPVPSSEEEPRPASMTTVYGRSQPEQVAVPSNSDLSGTFTTQDPFDKSASSDTKATEISDSSPLGLNWNTESDKLWKSDTDKINAIRNHQGFKPAGQTPGMFIHGIRFVRQHSRKELIIDDDIPDVACRLVIMTGLPDDVHVRRVLEHVRGGNVLKVQVLSVGDGADRGNMASIEFVTAEDAMMFYRYTRCREFGFVVDRESFRARTRLADTDSFPLNESLQKRLAEGCTRCLSVTGFPVMHLPAILNFVGISRILADTITHFCHFDDGSFEISFSDVRTAITAHDYILRSKFYEKAQDSSGVTFQPDPCGSPLDDLQCQAPFIPNDVTFDLTILNSDNAEAFITKEERALDAERLEESIKAATSPDDREPFSDWNSRKNIVWEKYADWDKAQVYTAYDPDQRREVQHQRDPASGAVRTKYHGTWVITPDEARKEWLHYNHNSPHPWTQKTADLLYAGSGDIDIRKTQIIVDDGGLAGDADQSMKQDVCYENEAPEEETETSISVSVAPSLMDIVGGFVPHGDASKYQPMGVWITNPSLLDDDVPIGGSLADRTNRVPPHLRGRNKNCGSSASSSSRSVKEADFGGPVHGISKSNFNQLAAKVAKGKSNAAVKRGLPFKPFW